MNFKDMLKNAAVGNADCNTNAEGKNLGLSEYPLQFLLIMQKNADPDSLTGFIKRSIDIISETKSAMPELFPPFILVTLKVGEASDDGGERLSLVRKLSDEFTDSAAIIHGYTRHALMGNVGNGAPYYYTTVIPNFERMMQTLLDAKGGSVIEWS